ncbi:renalase-like isoform X2 [Mercenaria mercenaria]|nr:renalase-like isoform X2 [Mercenaria mercenaria]
MSTSRCNKDGRCTVDLGAQYISATPDYQQSHAKYYAELTEKGVLQRLDCEIEGHQDKVPGTKHFVTPDGVSSLVKYYVNKADPLLGKGYLVKDVSVADDKVKVTTDEGHSEQFDAVVITMPVAQILQLQGDIASLIDKKDVRSALQSVSYSSRFAVGLFYEPGTKLDIPWAAKYITDNPCIRYVSVDNRKRGKNSDDVGPSICVHTAAPWGLKNIEMDKDDAAVEILKQLKTVLPGLPDPVEVKGHKWRYSQVHKGYPDSPGCVVLCEKPAIILAGDAFTHSNFDGCLESAISVQQTLTKLIKSKV